MSTEALMTQIKSQLAEAYAQEFLEVGLYFLRLLIVSFL